MIANCGVLGLDWRHTSLSAYFEAFEAHNAAHDPEAKGDVAEQDFSRLRRAMKAQRVH